jgi:UDP-glucose 4-epimerase
VVAGLLRRKLLPTVLGFDPMMQVMHEDDEANAVGCALAPGVRGVFNVTGPGEVPLSLVIREAGVRSMPIPEPIYGLLLGRMGLPQVGAGALEFLKHPCLIDGSRFREATGFQPSRGLRDTLASMRV